MISPVSSASPIRFSPLSGQDAPASAPSPFDKPKGPTTISISREAFEALETLEKGSVAKPQDPVTYDKTVKALLAARQDVIGRGGGIDLGDTGNTLVTNPYTAPFAADVAPLYGMLKDGASAKEALTAALTSILPQQGQRTDTTYAAEFALKHMKMTAIADRLIAPEHKEEATAILGRVFDSMADATPIRADLATSTLTIARSGENADTRVSQIVALVNKSLDAGRQNMLTDRQRHELTEMTDSWQDFQKLLPRDASAPVTA
ncbi:hypothetical protein [Sphingomonas sp. 1185]|uniref:hypothetical protein n=1 Tax=Sphingomonas sp. 1185 TaxID=3156411 RepID=UPI0033915230